MTTISMLSLALAMLILAASPGPGVFATVARSLASGFRPTLWLIAGIVASDTVYLLFAVFGLSAFARQFGELFVLIKLLGGAYLIWLGLQIFFSKPSTQHPATAAEKSSPTANFLSGLLITLSNPKVILFYCGFLPTFADLTALNAADILSILTVVTLVLGSVLTGYAYTASRARRFLGDPKSAKRLNRSAGGIMIAAGTVMATKA